MDAFLAARRYAVRRAVPRGHVGAQWGPVLEQVGAVWTGDSWSRGANVLELPLGGVLAVWADPAWKKRPPERPDRLYAVLASGDLVLMAAEYLTAVQLPYWERYGTQSPVVIKG